MANEMPTLIDLAAASKSKIQKGLLNILYDDDANSGNAILRWLPVKQVNTLNPSFFKYNSEGNASMVSWRPIGGTYTSGMTSHFLEDEMVANLGSEILIDEAFKFEEYQTELEPMAFNLKRRMELIYRFLNNKLVNGARLSDPYGINGLLARVTANQTIDVTQQGAYSAGLDVGPLAATPTTFKAYLNVLDDAIEAVGGSSGTAAIWMNNSAKRALRRACRELGLYKQTEDAYQRRVDTYYDVPIMNPGAVIAQTTLAAATANSVLPNNVQYTSGAATTCQIMVVKKGEDAVHLMQAQGLEVNKVVKADTNEHGPYDKVRLSWYIGLAVKRESAISLIKGVRAI